MSISTPNDLLELDESNLDNSLSMPSFEEELKASEIPYHRASKVAHVETCRVCGNQVMVGPGDIFRCPKAAHDIEDDTHDLNDFFTES